MNGSVAKIVQIADENPIDLDCPDLDCLHLQVERLRAIAKESAQLSLPGIARKAADILEAIDRFSTKVTFVGQVKAGKTSLVNALAQAPHLLPSDVNPWTSVVTTVHINTPPPGGQRAVFEFFKPDEWQRLVRDGGRLGEMARRAQHSDELAKLKSQLDTMRANSERRLGNRFELLMGNSHRFANFTPELIARYVCLGDEDDGPKNGQYADVTRAAALYLKADVFPMPMALRDTPGVNDPFLVREQVTLNSLADTDICVVVLSAHQAMSTVDLALIRIILTLKAEQIILFVNRIDELDDPASQIAEIEADIRETLHNQGLDPTMTILLGSAHWAEAAQEDAVGALDASSAAALRSLSGGLAPGRGDALQHSGLPALKALLDQKIQQGTGPEFLRKTIDALANMLGQAVTLARQVDLGPMDAGLSAEDIAQRFVALSRKHRLAIEKQLDIAIFALRDKMNNAVEDFIAQQISALAERLNAGGKAENWVVESSDIRRHLKAGYDVFVDTCAGAIARCYKAAAHDITAQYTAIGQVNDVQIAPPPLPRMPIPTALGQTLTLDLGRGWWSRIFGGVRRADEVIKALRGALQREMGPLLREIELEHAGEIFSASLAGMDRFLADHRETLMALVSNSESQVDRQSALEGRLLAQLARLPTKRATGGP